MTGFIIYELTSNHSREGKLKAMAPNEWPKNERTNESSERIT